VPLVRGSPDFGNHTHTNTQHTQTRWFVIGKSRSPEYLGENIVEARMYQMILYSWKTYINDVPLMRGSPEYFETLHTHTHTQMHIHTHAHTH